MLIVRSATQVRGELLEKAKKLRLIGRAGEGLDNVDMRRTEELGITVVNTPHVSYVSVAELTIAHLLALARGIVEGTLSLRQGEWKKDELLGIEINGKTLGVIGCGYIGKTVDLNKTISRRAEWDKKLFVNTLFCPHIPELY